MVATYYNGTIQDATFGVENQQSNKTKQTEPLAWLLILEWSYYNMLNLK